MADRTVLLMATLLVASLVAVPGAAGAAPAGGQATDAGQDATVGVTERDAQTTEANETDWCAPHAGGKQREHPDEDTLGFENGCWYDDPLNIDRSNGLNETELDAVVGRAMARVEQVRKLEFEHNIPVKIISREEFANQTSSRNYSENFRLHQNVKYEALFMVGEDTSAIKEQQENRAGNVQGYYSPSEDQIVIISPTETPKMDEITLAQELFHGLQQQKFDMDYNWSTQERHNANDGIIEGDGNYVDYLYEQRCNEEWNCLMPEGGGPGVAPPGFHWGLYSLTIQPYSEGPEFVAQIHQNQGWEAVNKLYANPPQSTEQTIHPDKYGEDEPREMSFTDKSNDEWNVLQVEGGPNYAEFGETGLFAMLWYPAQRGEGVTVIGQDYFFNAQGSNGGGFHNYDHPMSAGWDGDRLYPYVNASSSETGETGYVWKIAFDSEKDASEFLRGYDSLLWGYGFEVDGRQNTYVVRDGAFEDAYYYEQQGDTVIIVNAPSVEDLDEIRAGASPEATPTPTPSPTPTPEETATPTPTAAETPAGTPTETQAPTATPTPTPTEELTTTAAGGETDAGGAETTAGSGPGFGALLALTALALTLAVAALARRR